MLFLLFFLLRDGAAMLHAALGLVPVPASRKAALVAHIGSVTRAVVFGTLVTAAVQGISVGVGFALVGLPSPIVFGALAAALPSCGDPPRCGCSRSVAVARRCSCSCGAC